MDLANWSGRPRPERRVLEGRWCRLEPLAAAHAADLYAAARAEGERFRWLPDAPPADEATFRAWLERAAASEDPLFWAVIDRASGRAEGRQSLLRLDPANGVAEVGHILWGPAIARTRVATEAIALFAGYVFDDLGYRRFEWKCNDRNEPSKRAAVRFGFTPEGVFRHHMVVKGENRDTAWFAIVAPEWPALQVAFARWLDPANFDADGRQRERLEALR